MYWERMSGWLKITSRVTVSFCLVRTLILLWTHPGALFYSIHAYIAACRLFPWGLSSADFGRHVANGTFGFNYRTRIENLRGCSCDNRLACCTRGTKNRFPCKSSFFRHLCHCFMYSQCLSVIRRKHGRCSLRATDGRVNREGRREQSRRVRKKRTRPYGSEVHDGTVQAIQTHPFT